MWGGRLESPLKFKFCHLKKREDIWHNPNDSIPLLLKGLLPLNLGEKWGLSPSLTSGFSWLPSLRALLSSWRLWALWRRLGLTGADWGRPPSIALPEPRACRGWRAAARPPPHKVVNEMQINVSDFTKNQKVKVTTYKREKFKGSPGIIFLGKHPRCGKISKKLSFRAETSSGGCSPEPNHVPWTFPLLPLGQQPSTRAPCPTPPHPPATIPSHPTALGQTCPLCLRNSISHPQAMVCHTRIPYPHQPPRHSFSQVLIIPPRMPPQMIRDGFGLSGSF